MEACGLREESDRSSPGGPHYYPEMMTLLGPALLRPPWVVMVHRPSGRFSSLTVNDAGPRTVCVFWEGRGIPSQEGGPGRGHGAPCTCSRGSGAVQRCFQGDPRDSSLSTALAQGTRLPPLQPLHPARAGELLGRLPSPWSSLAFRVGSWFVEEARPLQDERASAGSTRRRWLIVEAIPWGCGKSWVLEMPSPVATSSGVTE